MSNFWGAVQFGRGYCQKRPFLRVPSVVSPRVESLGPPADVFRQQPQAQDYFRSGRGRRRRTRQLRRLVEAAGGSGERPSSLPPPPIAPVHPAHPRATTAFPLPRHTLLPHSPAQPDQKGPVRDGAIQLHPAPSTRNNAPGRRAFWVELPGPGAIVAAGGA